MGWSVGRNVRIDYRWGAGDDNRVRRYAGELVAFAPDVIVAAGGLTVRPLLNATSTVPIVFDALDPVGIGCCCACPPSGHTAAASDGWKAIKPERDKAIKARSYVTEGLAN